MGKKLTKKATKVLRTDVLVSVAATSILINVFFIAGLLTFTGTNAIDQEVYDLASKNLCDKHYQENLSEYMEASDVPELTKLKFEALCKTGDFSQYHQNALEAYISDNL